MDQSERAPMNLVEDLVAANRILAEHGVIDAYGHVSVRSAKDPLSARIERSSLMTRPS